MIQFTYFFKNKFKMNQIWVKWFKDIIKLIVKLLDESIQVKFVLCRLTQNLSIY